MLGGVTKVEGVHYRDKTSERYINWICILDSMWGYQEVLST